MSEEAKLAMMQAPGRPVVQGNGKPADMAAAELSRKSAANSLTLFDRINEMASRDAEDWRWLTDTLRKFVAQRRTDLDYLERLLGTSK